ncbi:MAG: Sulfotransferase [Candidatus Jettenia ecosi]|uniref:Sulfotransferase n=1 Tax=Candidatus Jettenia ecosi TaxID=2494326 RepID=A0A533QCF0_9BACT|nr:MAG: Sulfotransferase [Candidatus Jettenia ecosi]
MNLDNLDKDTKLPNFIIVGAAKSGTTSLYNYLDEHPDVYMSPIKEPNHFSSDIEPEKFNKAFKKHEREKRIDLDEYLNGNMDNKLWGDYVQKWEQYRKLFKNVKHEKAIGEVSNSYLFSQVAAKNIIEKLPQVKIIMMLRNPMERAFSHYLANMRDGKTIKNFREEVESNYTLETREWGKKYLYIELGMYYQQVKRYLDVFPRENIKIYFYDDYKKDLMLLVKDLFRFIGVNPNITIDFSKKYNESKIPKNKYFNFIISKSGIKKSAIKLFPLEYREKIKSIFFTNEKKPKLSVEDKKFLLGIYREDIKNLSHVMNRDLHTWLEITK